jgi:predicted transcriptional regulator
MKTKEKIQEEINQLTDEVVKKQQENPEKSYSRMFKKIEQLRFVKKYAETNPSPEFLNSEVERIEKIIDSKNAQFNDWVENLLPGSVREKEYRTVFNREVGINKLKEQLRTINFLID